MKRLYLAAGGVALATVVAIVVAVVAFSGGGGAGAGAGDTSAAATDGTSEGITVHGHWVVEVREPDGALVSRHDFDNDVVPEGKETLARLMARDNSMNLWRVLLGGDQKPCLSDTGPNDCVVAEPSSDLPPEPFRFFNLTVSRSGSEVQLSGTATAQVDASIGMVFTRTTQCASNQAPGTCSEWVAPTPFSDTGLPSPIGVLAGQQILVNVTFTFS